MADRWVPPELYTRNRDESRRDDPAAPGGPADVAAGRHGDHWHAPRDYGALADAAGRRGAHDAWPAGTPPRDNRDDPFAPQRYRYDMQAPPVELHDGEQLVGGRGFSGLAREAERAQPRQGPKDYRRSDDRIREDICEGLIAATHLDASEVSVDVKETVVVLDGIVPDRRMKHAIEDIAANCRGVTDVQNRIRVVRGGADPLLDPASQDRR
jgi:hypothetical protein